MFGAKLNHEDRRVNRDEFEQEDNKRWFTEERFNVGFSK